MTEAKKYIRTAHGTQDEITDEIVRQMWRLIRRDKKHTKIVSKANELKQKSRYETIKSIFEYVRNNYSYKPDPAGVEHLTAPIHIIEGNAPYMDCDELIIITVSLLQALNIPCLIKTIAWRKKEYTHVVCEVQLNENEWIVLDPTRADGFGNQERKVIREKRYK